MVRNADITLYHKEYDPTKRIDVWTHAQYEGVSWHGRQAATVGDNGRLYRSYLHEGGCSCCQRRYYHPRAG